MARKDVDADLTRCLAGGPNSRWHGERALARLYPGIDAKRVARVMRIVVPWNPAGTCRKLPDEFIPVARAVLAKTRSPAATFLLSYAGDVRAGCEWLRQLEMFGNNARNQRRLEALCADTSAVAAARAAVVAYGADATCMLAVLARDGHAESVDALVDVVGRALAARDANLDVLSTWLVPFARNARMTALGEELRRAIEERSAGSDVLALGRTFDPHAKRFRLQVAIESRQHRGVERHAYAWIVLQSHALPNAKLTVHARTRSTRWEDGTCIRDDNRLRMPRGLDDLPRWLAASARKLQIAWDPARVRTTTTLRGKARAAAIEWLLAGSG